MRWPKKLMSEQISAADPLKEGEGEAATRGVCVCVCVCETVLQYECVCVAEIWRHYSYGLFEWSD